ncbi:hypothetical protein, partial [Leptospira interrogans]|uniref:hypothetical protein n=1 Tax=Leptospira interrogans TaxID=173 RepID=UPI0002BA5AAE
KINSPSISVVWKLSIEVVLLNSTIEFFNNSIILELDNSFKNIRRIRFYLRLLIYNLSILSKIDP